MADPTDGRNLCFSLSDQRDARLTGFLAGVVVAILVILVLAARRSGNASPTKWVAGILGAGFLWVLAGFIFRSDGGYAASLQIGLLDPIALLHRSINLIVLPLLDATNLKLSASPRLYEGSWLIGSIFISALLLNLLIPRFYCRFICPLGALLGPFKAHDSVSPPSVEGSCSARPPYNPC